MHTFDESAGRHGRLLAGEQRTKIHERKKKAAAVIVAVASSCGGRGVRLLVVGARDEASEVAGRKPLSRCARVVAGPRTHSRATEWTAKFFEGRVLKA